MAGTNDSREATMVGRRTDGTLVRRPLSPHLQAYDMLQMSSALSISHRITGVAWAGGLFFLACCSSAFNTCGRLGRWCRTQKLNQEAVEP